MNFSEKVNTVSSLISTMTNDVGERYGIAMAVTEILRHTLMGSIIPIQQTREDQKTEQEFTES